MARSVSEILKDADSEKDLQGLVNLWNEIANNKYEYPLVELHFANEHIRELALKSYGSDIQKGHFYMSLNQMVTSPPSS